MRQMSEITKKKKGQFEGEVMGERLEEREKEK